MELHPIDYDSAVKDVKKPVTPVEDMKSINNFDLVKAFLDGDNCLEGGVCLNIYILLELELELCAIGSNCPQI